MWYQAASQGAALVQFFWSLPIIVVAVLVASGRAGSIGAGLGGTLCGLVVALAAAPVHFDPRDAALAVAKGIWLAWLVGAVILGGLFFREIVSASAAETGSPRAHQQRRRLFTACFFVGPFAEAATGFGVGQVAIVSMIQNTGISAIQLVLFALFSQILVPWGAMANGTMVGAALSGVSPGDLGVHSAMLTAPLLLAWLVLYWRIVAAAGVPGTRAAQAGELAWVLAIAGVLVVANLAVGPEIAAMLALGPLIVFRFWQDEHPDRARWLSMLQVGVPYGVVILGLALTRAVPRFGDILRDTAVLRPFDDSPSFAPLLHPGCWLAAVAIVTAFVLRRGRDLTVAAGRTWVLGRKAVMTIGLYLVMAQIMRTSGMAAELAKAMNAVLGPLAILATPLLGATFGFLTGSSNAANGLLMPSQAALAAENQLSVAWVAALQNTAAAALTMLSPVRVAMGCALAGSPGLERSAYARAWPLGAAAIAVLTTAAGLLLILS
jgi:lactate permease